jgi:hypothetical protein
MAGVRRRRSALVGLLVGLTCLSAVAATVSIWARALVLNTDRWTELSDQLIREPEVVDALSARLSTSIVEGLEVEERVRNALAGAERLPTQITLLARPVTATIQDVLEDRIATFLQSEEGRHLWVRVSGAAHERVVAVLRGETGPGVTVEEGTVTLNTVPLINRGLGRSEDLIAGILGRPVSLPSAEEIAATGTADEARELLEARLGVDLPDDLGEIVVFRSDRLAAAQDAVRLLDRFITLIILVTFVLLVASLTLSVDRRRTLLQLGIGVLLGALLARLAVRAVEGAIVNAAGSRGAAREVVGTVFSGLVTFIAFLVVAGIVAAAAAYLAGHPAWLNRGRERFRTRGIEAWAGAHVDGLRVAGIAVAVITLFLVDLSWTIVIVVVLLLVAYELGLRSLAGRGASADAPD